MENFLFVLETLLALRSHEVKKCPAFGGAQLSMTLKQEPTHTLTPTNQKFTHARLHPSRISPPWKHPLGPRKTKQLQGFPDAAQSKTWAQDQVLDCFKLRASWSWRFDLLKPQPTKQQTKDGHQNLPKKTQPANLSKNPVKMMFHVLIQL